MSAPLAAPLPRPTACSVCNIDLPKTATTPVCEECDDPARQIPTPPPARPLHVVHNGTTHRDTTTCPHCTEPLIYSDDRRDGYHTSNSKCVRAHKKGA